MANNIKWLLGLLLIVLGWVFYLAQGESSAVEQDQFLLPDWQSNPELLNSFDRVELTKGGETINLTKVNDQWVLNGGFFADQTPLFKLLKGLQTGKIIEKKTALAKNHAHLGLAEADLKVSVFNQNGVQAALHIGKTGNGDTTFVRLANQNQTYTVAPFESVPFNVGQWRLNTVLDVAPEQVVKVEFDPAEGDAFSVSRNLQGQQLEWVGLAEDMQLKDNVYLDQLVSGLSRLLIDEAIPRDLAAASLVTQINYELGDGTPITLQLHKLEEVDWLTVESPAYPHYANWQFKLAEYKATALNRQATDFIEPKSIEPTISDD